MQQTGNEIIFSRDAALLIDFLSVLSVKEVFVLEPSRFKLTATT